MNFVVEKTHADFSKSLFENKLKNKVNKDKILKNQLE